MQTRSKISEHSTFMALIASSFHRVQRSVPRRFGALLLLACWLSAMASTAWSGTGRVNDDGTIDFTVNLRYVPTEANLADVRESIIGQSRKIWDATEGKMRFGQVTLTSGEVNLDQADVWLYSIEDVRELRSMSYGHLGEEGGHIDLRQGALPKLAHELGHLALGLADEYAERPCRFSNCWGVGPCIERADRTERNHCLMQEDSGGSEFCTAAGHDTLRGDGLTCADRAVPDLDCDGDGTSDCTPTERCELFNHTTGQYETSSQSYRDRENGGRSCWEVLVEQFPFLEAPADLPIAAEPPDFVEPTFVEEWDLTDTVLLVLDRSGSMAWHPNEEDGEVCGDGVDNDEDGEIDESGCKPPRLEFLKAAARSWLALAENEGLRVGILSFNHQTESLEAFQDLNGANLPGLTDAVDRLEAGGDTAIGEALQASAALFDEETRDRDPDPRNPTVFLISDGINTDGPEPETVVGDLRERGIRVFAVSTGEASDSETLSDISGETGGDPVDSRDATTLVNALAQQFARYRNITTLLPRQPYRSGQTILLQIEPGPNKISLVAAGNHSTASPFGARLILTPVNPGPPVYDSDLSRPNQRVVYDSHFTLMEISHLNPGQWKLSISYRKGAAVAQTGHLTVLLQSPECRLFTGLDHHVVDPGQPVKLTVAPIYHTVLRNVDTLTATLKCPDGVNVPLLLSSDYATGGDGNYQALIAGQALPGRYEVHVAMETGPNTFNDPGESIDSAVPPNTVAVPRLTRSAIEYFFVRPPHHKMPNDNPASATPLDSRQLSHKLQGEIAPGNPADFYSFTAPQNSKAWITVDTGGPIPSGASRDSILSLFTWSTLIERDDNDGCGNGGDSTLESGNASAIAGRTLTQSSTSPYFLRVTGVTPDETSMPYRLYLTLTSGAATPETENNNSPTSANPIVTASTSVGVRAGTLSSTNDVDYYSVVGQPGNVLHISADGDPARDGTGTDLRVELLDKLGALLFSANSSGSGSAANPAAEGFCFAIDSPYPYYVRVRPVQGPGSYQLMVCRVAASTGLIAPTLSQIHRLGGELRFNVPTEAGVSYQVQQTGGLGGSWVTLPGIVVGSGGTETISVTVSGPQGFFRIVRQR